jgi:hypothetical protein
MEETMFKKIILATVLLTLVSPNAFAEDQPKVPKKKVETIRKNFEGKLKDIESQERLDNFGIQELMSDYTPPPPPPSPQ